MAANPGPLEALIEAAKAGEKTADNARNLKVVADYLAKAAFSAEDRKKALPFVDELITSADLNGLDILEKEAFFNYARARFDAHSDAGVYQPSNFPKDLTLLAIPPLIAKLPKDPYRVPNVQLFFSLAKFIQPMLDLDGAEFSSRFEWAIAQHDFVNNLDDKYVQILNGLESHSGNWGRYIHSLEEDLHSGTKPELAREYLLGARNLREYESSHMASLLPFYLFIRQGRKEKASTDYTPY